MANLAKFNSAAFVPSAGLAALASGATIEVRRMDTGALASIFSDEAGTAPITNPSAFADSNGNFSFCAAGLERGYSVKVTSGAFNFTITNVAIGTAAQFDATTYTGTLLASATAPAARTTLGLPAVTAKGDMHVATAADTLAKKAAPANGFVRMADSAQADGWQDVPAAFAFKNRLINPDGGIYQRAVAATADDTYFADRWYLLTQTGTVTPSVLSAPEDGFPSGVRITQSQAVAQRFGFAQIIEGKNCKDLRGKSGVMVPRIRCSSAQAIRYAILAWTGTEDAVVSDVVNDWTSADYTDGAAKFFVDANFTPLVVGAQTPSANVWTSLAAITAALGSTFNNLVLVVWTEGTAAQNVTLDFDYVQFERGSVATEFERRPQTMELGLCQRFLAKTFKQDVAPAQNAGFAGALGSINITGSFGPRATWKLPVTMRAVPTITTFNPGAANANWRNAANTGDVAFSAESASYGHDQATLSSTGTGATSETYYIHATAEAEL